MNRPLYLAAIRVLGQITSRMDYSPEDLSLLRRHARPGETKLPIDILCCEIIQRELGKPNRRLGPVPVDPKH
jgi:hypothetical protein